MLPSNTKLHAKASSTSKPLTQHHTSTKTITASSPSSNSDHPTKPIQTPNNINNDQPSYLRRSLLLSATSSIAALATPLPSSADHGALVLHQPPPPSHTHTPRVGDVRMIMRVTALRGSVPQQWVLDFKTAMEGYGIAAVSPKPQFTDIWNELKGTTKATKNVPTTVDCVSLGDTWLQRAIQEDLIQPIEGYENSRWWSLLGPRWKQLIKRDENGLPSRDGSVYGVPYRWGATLIAYRKDRVIQNSNQPIVDWSDLLRPELKGRIAFLDSPRDLVAVAFKTLGLSVNASAGEAAGCGISQETIIQRVRQLIDQVKVFSSVDHVRALAAGEVDVAVGWSEDLIPVADRANTVELVAPKSGMPLWADMWCVPKNAAGGPVNGEPSPLLPSWFEIGLQPSRAIPSKGLKGGASPLLLPQTTIRTNFCDVVNDVVTEDILWGTELPTSALPVDEVLQRSEFLLPLKEDKGTIDLYRKCLGKKM